jgi:hypothetical protein
MNDGGRGALWLGYVLGNAGPDEQSCQSGPGGPVTCTSHGQPYAPGFDLGAALPWFVVGTVVTLASLAAYLWLVRVRRPDPLLTTGAAGSP